MPEISSFVLMFIMVAIQSFMSRRQHVIFGVFIPILFAVYMTWMFSTGEIDSVLKYVILLIVGLIILVAEWSNGRKAVRKCHEEEMNKMKTQDIK
ncbi:hypothetical protein SFC66_04980 [Terribacillus saccharophilus]|uniref:hypothetical protein n=1 Tax=Terribacillus saccharophilus TaxID=361277 RepID=UPI003981A35C